MTGRATAPGLVTLEAGHSLSFFTALISRSKTSLPSALASDSQTRVLASLPAVTLNKFCELPFPYWVNEANSSSSLVNETVPGTQRIIRV